MAYFTKKNLSRIIWQYIRRVLFNYYVALFYNHNFLHVLKTNVVGSWKHIPYSYWHSKCYIDVEEYLKSGSDDKERHKWHDMDKIIMFILFPWLGPDCINDIHTLTQSHHPCYWADGKKWNKSWWAIDWNQAVVDWECARFTKPDKPLDAYDTLMKYYYEDPKFFRSAIDAMIDLGLYYDKGTPIGRTVGKTGVMDGFLECYPRWKQFSQMN